MARKLPMPDPIFAALAAVAKAERDEYKTLMALNRIEEALDAAFNRNRKDGSEPACVRITSDNPRLILTPEYQFESYGEIDKHLDRVFGVSRPIGPKAKRGIKAVKKIARCELRAMLDHAIKNHRAAQKSCGLITAREINDRADMFSAAVTRKMCATVPTTAEGLEALIAWTEKEMEGVLQMYDNRGSRVFDTLKRGAARLAQRARP